MLAKLTKTMVNRVGFGMQCFWGAEALFGSLNGIVTTRVGYEGGSTPAPTYRNIANHIETVDVQFDSSQISFEELLNIFFSSHDPTLKHKRQYASAIFYHDDHQLSSITNLLKNKSTEFGSAIATELIAHKAFHNAEDYHQKYFLRKYPQLLDELNLDNAQIITSPIATRLNGFCAGFGSLQQLQQENFTLSEKNINLLRELIKRGPNLYECGL